MECAVHFSMCTDGVPSICAVTILYYTVSDVECIGHVSWYIDSVEL